MFNGKGKAMNLRTALILGFVTPILWNLWTLASAAGL